MDRVKRCLVALVLAGLSTSALARPPKPFGPTETLIEPRLLGARA
jgi:hypothetical protein